MRRRDFLATLCAAIVIPSVPAFAAPREPFGVPAYPRYTNQVEGILKYLREEKESEIERIVQEIKTKHAKFPLGWISQLVQLSPERLGTDNQCAFKAVAKCLVAKRLGFPARYVAGDTAWSTATSGHAMAAVWYEDEWRMMDNEHVIPRFETPTDRQVSNYKPPRSFVARWTLEF